MHVRFQAYTAGYTLLLHEFFLWINKGTCSIGNKSRWFLFVRQTEKWSQGNAFTYPYRQMYATYPQRQSSIIKLDERNLKRLCRVESHFAKNCSGWYAYMPEINVPHCNLEPKVRRPLSSFPVLYTLVLRKYILKAEILLQWSDEFTWHKWPLVTGRAKNIVYFIDFFHETVFFSRGMHKYYNESHIVEKSQFSTC